MKYMLSCGLYEPDGASTDEHCFLHILRDDDSSYLIKLLVSSALGGHDNHPIPFEFVVSCTC